MSSECPGAPGQQPPSPEESGHVDNSTFFARDFAHADDGIMERVLAIEPDANSERFKLLMELAGYSVEQGVRFGAEVRLAVAYVMTTTVESDDPDEEEGQEGTSTTVVVHSADDRDEYDDHAAVHRRSSYQAAHW